MATLYLRRDEAERLHDELEPGTLADALAAAIAEGKPAPRKQACVRVPFNPGRLAFGKTVKQVSPRRWEVCDSTMLALHFPWTLRGTIRKLNASDSVLAHGVAKDAKLNARED